MNVATTVGETTHTAPLTVTVNGQERSAQVETRFLLVHFLRETLGLTGTHIGCDTTSCGACTVLVDGVPTKSCTMFAVQAAGREIATVEGLAQGTQLHAIQQGFHVAHHVGLTHLEGQPFCKGSPERKLVEKRSIDSRY